MEERGDKDDSCDIEGRNHLGEGMEVISFLGIKNNK